MTAFTSVGAVMFIVLQSCVIDYAHLMDDGGFFGDKGKKYFEVLEKCKKKATVPLAVSGIISIFAGRSKLMFRIMTATEVNAELFRTMGIIAEDEGLMKKLLKYAKKLAAQKEDPTCVTKEEFFARVDEAKKGPSYRMLPDEDLTTFLRRLGHDV